MTLVQKEPKAIKLGKLGDYSAMQGPAPDGFHVPLNTERQAVYDIRTALGGGSSDGTNFGIALKLPFAGARGRTNGSTNSQGTMGAYYSSVRKTNTYAYFLVFTSSVLLPQNADYYSNAYSIRPFKDTATIPTSSWTKLYGTSIEAGGIFWSSTDGLISLSSDGNTWITIADKNLGATTVWNSGNTLSEANSGKYYQWGNNYGFPFTGSVTTSSSQVNAQNYGPGNYYNSSTFITYSSGWDSSDNWNLRGGVTGVQPLSIKKVYLGSTQVRPGPVNFATQGPCPDGFHVPLQSELQTVYDTGWCSYLKLPHAGSRDFSNGGISNQGRYGYYWSSSPHSDSRWAYYIRDESGYVISRNRRAWGISIRPFKDEPVQPDSSWTVLYQGSGNAGVYHNQSLGLISLSTNGTTRITIADKNLGATQVWNSSDAVSEANCGGYFQRGNNYMFPRTGSVTTSGAQVNASDYGPGNYYSSSTFITGDSWDSSGNGNLRGGEDGNVPV